jgi:beta-glucanase (GH16 family)
MSILKDMRFSFFLSCLFWGVFGYFPGISQHTFTRLVWQDEFDIDGMPDSSRWVFDLGTGCPNVCGWGNAELQSYTNRPQNIKIENGILTIKALKENYQGAAYTSARIKTKGKFAFTYGKIEVRAKVPEGLGTWPAIWLLGNNIDEVGWPACGEMDVMEHKGNALNRIYGTLHYPQRHGGNPDGNYIETKTASSQFHVYAIEWSKDLIKIKMDDLVIHQAVNKKEIPFHHDFFILLNLAMGGHFGGNVNPDFKHDDFEVDYVRVFQ